AKSATAACHVGGTASFHLRSAVSLASAAPSAETLRRTQKQRQGLVHHRGQNCTILHDASCISEFGRHAILIGHYRPLNLQGILQPGVEHNFGGGLRPTYTNPAPVRGRRSPPRSWERAVRMHCCNRLERGAISLQMHNNFSTAR